MAYKLKPGKESVETGIRRIASSEFARMAEVLADTDMLTARRVHEVRKGAKRLRSMIRLVAPVFTEAKAENEALRDAARKLSSARDMGAVLDSLGQLKLPEAIFSEAITALEGNSERAEGGGNSEKLLKSFRKDIEAAGKRALKWKLDAEGFDAIAPGLTQTYRRLRKDYATATSSREEEATHDWRKSAKTHWHQTLLIAQICPDALDAHARMASRLSESLGKWRDDGLLLAALDALSAEQVDKDIVKAVRRAAIRGQKRHLARAERVSALLTAESPKAFAARCKAYWEAATR